MPLVSTEDVKHCQAEVFTHAAVYMNRVRGAVHSAGNQANLIF